jgi:hypothetical protein
MPRYFDLTDNMRIKGRWHLRTPLDEHGEEVAPWQFKKGKHLDIRGAIRFPVRPTGKALEFTLASFAIPVVHVRVVALFERLRIQEVQFIPVQVDDTSEPHFILNTLRIIRCIDDARCEEVKRWTPEDGQPEKVGEYRNVVGMRIDTAQADGTQVFRPWGWRVALLVSEEVKQALEREGITGTQFDEV